MNTLGIFLTSYLTYFAYFVVSSYFQYSMSMATLQILFTFPQFYLCIFLISSMGFLFDKACNFFKINFYDEPVTLLSRYLKVLFKLLIF